MEEKTIADLKPRMKNVLLNPVEVTEVGPSKEYSRMGGIGKVGSALIKDGSGTATLTLWNEQCDLLQQGDKIKLTSIKTSEWQGNLQISTDFKGEIEKL